MFPRLVSLVTKSSIERIQYSERLVWERNTFEPILHALAQYYKIHPRWGLISAFGGGVDGRRSLAHSSLVRHYMDRCGTWTSSYRLVLGLLQEIDVQPQFDNRMLADSDHESAGEAASEALWDVIFARLSALQEYGWHAGLEPLMWASDAVNGSLAELSWSHLKQELASQKNVWAELIIRHAKDHDAFFRRPTKILPLSMNRKSQSRSKSMHQRMAGYPAETLIKPWDGPPPHAVVRVPGSKSLTNRRSSWRRWPMGQAF